MHHIRGLIWARRATQAPWPKPRGQKGTKALGLRFEKIVARAFAKSYPAAEHGPWFQFQDTQLRGFCSPDLLLTQGQNSLIIECKLANVEEAWAQLSLLYVPVVELALETKVMAVVVVKYVGPGMLIVTTLREAVARRRERPVLHWLGEGEFPL